MIKTPKNQIEIAKTMRVSFERFLFDFFVFQAFFQKNPNYGFP